ncbi:MAG TPA: hypothetical protein VKV80_15930 [Streptosporangiaceae bacterium]|nr:hypothetical protein [Streptosporangiaceae bacterium]
MAAQPGNSPACRARHRLLRRARHRLRAHVSGYPAVYLPFARLKYPGPSPEVISPRTELVIDGYFRSANTFAVYAFQLSQDRPVRLAHHLHAPAQMIAAARRGIPALLLIREPHDATLSELIYEPDVALPDALAEYCRYYERLLPWLSSFVVGEFEQVTHDFGAVIHRLNARFGTGFAKFTHTDASMRECFALMKHRGTQAEIVYGFESGWFTLGQLRRELPALACQPQPPELREAWIPAGSREHLKGALHRQWLRPGLARLRERAQLVYQEIRAAAGP